MFDPNLTFGDILTPPQAEGRFSSFPFGQLFDGKGFADWLNRKTNTYLWVMTFTCGKNFIQPPIERLIYNKGTPYAKQARQLEGIHTKLYLQFQHKKHIASYVGSANLVFPTLDDLIVKLEQEHNYFAKNYFNFYWDQTTKQ